MEQISVISLQELVANVKAKTTVEAKINIARTYSTVGGVVNVEGSNIDPDMSDLSIPVRLGDDTAAIPDGYGDFLLFASEGIVQEFVNNDPWFAGYSAVMVNISDVCAMGGLPVAVTDVVWAKDQDQAAEVWAGMNAACRAYGVPVVGGHTCYDTPKLGLSVSILGKAQKLITSFDAKANDKLMMVVDLDGAYYKNYPFWNASTNSEPTVLQKKIKLLADAANKGWCKAGKDISMGGLFGTLSMLLSTSKVGATVHLDQIPQVDDDLEKWLLAFPSYGYLLAVKENNVTSVENLFEGMGITAKVIGEFTDDKAFWVVQGNEKVKF